MRFDVQGKIRYVQLEPLPTGRTARVYGEYTVYRETGLGSTEVDAANGILTYLKHKMGWVEARFANRPIVTPIFRPSYGRS